MAETDDATKMLKWVIPSMVVLLLVVLAFTLERYTHPMPEQDCSKPYDYPICSRAGLPEMFTQPSTTALFLGIMLALLIAIFVCYVGYHSAVIEQATIVAPTATIGKVPVTQSAPVSVSVSSPQTATIGKVPVTQSAPVSVSVSSPSTVAVVSPSSTTPVSAVSSGTTINSKSDTTQITSKPDTTQPIANSAISQSNVAATVKSAITQTKSSVVPSKNSHAGKSAQTSSATTPVITKTHELPVLPPMGKPLHGIDRSKVK